MQTLHIKYEFSSERKSCPFPFGKISQYLIHDVICDIHSVVLIIMKKTFKETWCPAFTCTCVPFFAHFILLHLTRRKYQLFSQSSPGKIYKKSTSVLDQLLK